MKRIFLGVLVFLLSYNLSEVRAENRSLTYHSYASEESKNAVIAETFVTMKDLQDGLTEINRQKQTKACLIDDTFILDQNSSLVKWIRICKDEGTNIVAEVTKDSLLILGKFKGKNIRKRHRLENKSLQIYPKYSLSQFAMSGEKRMKLWTLRRDMFTKLPMQVINKGEKMILVNGKNVEVIKIYYSIVGKLREKHFNHNYYYRKLDGLFLKKEESKGRIEELVKE